MKSPMRFIPIGAASILLLAAGCAGSSSSSSSGSGTNPVSPVTNAASTIYVMQDNFETSTSSILELPANGQGSVAPTASIDGPANTIFYAVALDKSGNVYVGAETEVVYPPVYYEILEYAAGATGAATPIRTINTSTGASSLAVDSAGQIYAISQAGLMVYAANATGNATPVLQIPLSSALLDYPTSVAVDLQQNIYVNNLRSILVFPPAASKSVTPTRTITWPAQFGYAPYIAVDANGNIYAATDEDICGGLGCILSSSQIIEFPAGANGLVAPSNVLTITPNPAFPTLPAGASGVAIDSGGSLYALTTTGTDEGLGTPYILDTMSVQVFSPGAASSSSPAQSITSPAWTLSSMGGLAVR